MDVALFLTLLSLASTPAHGGYLPFSSGGGYVNENSQSHQEESFEHQSEDSNYDFVNHNFGSDDTNGWVQSPSLRGDYDTSDWFVPERPVQNRQQFQSSRNIPTGNLAYHPQWSSPISPGNRIQDKSMNMGTNGNRNIPHFSSSLHDTVENFDLEYNPADDSSENYGYKKPTTRKPKQFAFKNRIAVDDTNTLRPPNRLVLDKNTLRPLNRQGLDTNSLRPPNRLWLDTNTLRPLNRQGLDTNTLRRPPNRLWLDTNTLRPLIRQGLDTNTLRPPNRLVLDTNTLRPPNRLVLDTNTLRPLIRQGLDTNTLRPPNRLWLDTNTLRPLNRQGLDTNTLRPPNRLWLDTNTLRPLIRQGLDTNTLRPPNRLWLDTNTLRPLIRQGLDTNTLRPPNRLVLDTNTLRPPNRLVLDTDFNKPGTLYPSTGARTRSLSKPNKPLKSISKNNNFPTNQVVPNDILPVQNKILQPNEPIITSSFPTFSDAIKPIQNVPLNETSVIPPSNNIPMLTSKTEQLLPEVGKTPENYFSDKGPQVKVSPSLQVKLPESSIPLISNDTSPTIGKDIFANGLVKEIVNINPSNLLPIVSDFKNLNPPTNNVIGQLVKPAVELPSATGILNATTPSPLIVLTTSPPYVVFPSPVTLSKNVTPNLLSEKAIFGMPKDEVKPMVLPNAGNISFEFKNAPVLNNSPLMPVELSQVSPPVLNNSAQTVNIVSPQIENIKSPLGGMLLPTPLNDASKISNVLLPLEKVQPNVSVLELPLIPAAEKAQINATATLSSSVTPIFSSMQPTNPLNPPEIVLTKPVTVAASNLPPIFVGSNNIPISSDIKPDTMSKLPTLSTNVMFPSPQKVELISPGLTITKNNMTEIPIDQPKTSITLPPENNSLTTISNPLPLPTPLIQKNEFIVPAIPSVPFVNGNDLKVTDAPLNKPIVVATNTNLPALGNIISDTPQSAPTGMLVDPIPPALLPTQLINGTSGLIPDNNVATNILNVLPITNDSIANNTRFGNTETPQPFITPNLEGMFPNIAVQLGLNSTVAAGEQILDNIGINSSAAGNILPDPMGSDISPVIPKAEHSTVGVTSTQQEISDSSSGSMETGLDAKNYFGSSMESIISNRIPTIGAVDYFHFNMPIVTYDGMLSLVQNPPYFNDYMQYIFPY